MSIRTGLRPGLRPGLWSLRLIEGDQLGAPRGAAEEDQAEKEAGGEVVVGTMGQGRDPNLMGIMTHKPNSSMDS